MAKKAAKKKRPKRKPKKKSAAVAAPDVDKDWQARSDLGTLKEADAIASDKERLARATKEAEKEMAALKKVKKRKK